MSLASECRESVLERNALQQTVVQVKQEFEESRLMHRRVLMECDSLRQSLQPTVGVIGSDRLREVPISFQPQ
eukprot:1001752-Amphidinium_carterae.1